jgi:hypothetical protein
MNAWKMTASIPENRRILLDVPSDVPVGPVEIILVYQPQPQKTVYDIIDKACGSLEGSVFNTEKYMEFKKDERELDR